jgi:hypothetical protein
MRAANDAAKQLAGGATQAATALKGMAASSGSAAATSAAMTAAARAQAAALTAVASASRASSFQLNNLRYQLFDVTQTLALGMNPLMILMQQGPQIAQIWGPNEGGVGRAFKETGNMVGGLVSRFPVLTAAIAGSGLALAGLTYEINKSTKVSVGFGDVAKGALEALRDVIMNALQPAIKAISPWFDSAWNSVTSGVKTAGNLIINSFRAAFEDLKLVFSQFPNIVATAIGGAANLVVTGIEKMINLATSGIDALIGKVNSAFSAMGIPKLSTIGEVKLGRVDIGTAGTELSAALKGRNKSIASIMGSDPLGAFYKSTRKHAIENAQEDEGGGKRGKSDAEKMAEDYDKLVKSAQQFIAEQELEQRVVGMTTEAANALRNEQKLLNQAANDNITLTAAQRTQISGLATDMARAEAGAKTMKESFDFAKDTVKGFVSELRQGLQNGEGFWASFKKAALSALDKITDKLLNQVIDALFKVGDASGGAGGGAGGILASLGKLITSANGNVFNGGSLVPFANGGVVNGPTVFPMASGAGLMGEAGPEAIMPLQRMSDGRLGVAAMGGRGGGGGAQGVQIQIESRFAADGGFESAVTRVSRPLAQSESAAAAGQVARAVPAMVDARTTERQVRRIRPQSPY